MPIFLTPPEIERRNGRHHTKITALLTRALQEASAPPPPMVCPPDDRADTARLEEQMRNVSHARLIADNRKRERVGDMLALPDDVLRKEIQMTDIMDMMNAQHDAVLNNPWFVRVTTNRQRVVCEFLLANLCELLAQVPLRCRDFDLLPEQRLAILCMVVAMPVETFTHCEIPREAMEELTDPRRRKEPFDIRYCLEPNALPTFTVAAFCTGSGKTVMALMAVLALLCCRQRWEQLKTSFRDVLSTRVREAHSGLCKLNHLLSIKLARVGIIFVPHNMMSHWSKTAQSAIFGAKETYGQALDVLLWKGVTRDQSLKAAHESGKPVLWILPLESDSMKAISASPEIAYAACVMDELSSKMAERYDKPKSVPLFSYITQATIESLESCTHGAPRHPLRQAMGDNFLSMRTVKIDLKYADYKRVQQALEHYCKMSQFAAPEFVRRLVADGVVAYMPRGIVVHRVPLRCGTLAAIARGSDMVKLSLPDLASQLLDGKVSEAVRDRIKGIFERADVFQTSSILEELATELGNMPVAYTPTDHNAQQAVKRLKDRLTDIFNGTMPNCPVTLEPIPRERVRILKCCTAVLDADSIEGCCNRCPLCRGPIVTAGVAAVPDAQPSASKSEGKRPVKQQKLAFGAKASADSDSYDSDGGLLPHSVGRCNPPVDNEAAFEERIAEIGRACPYSVDGIIEIVQAQVAMDPTSRVLLCFAFEASQRATVRDIAERIGAEVPGSNITDIEQCARNPDRFDAAKAKFDDRRRHPSPQLFIINTTESSSSVQGLDLLETDLIVIGDQCSMHTQRQALGRGLRMQKRPRDMNASERFPAKRVVVAAIGHYTPTAAADAAAAGNDFVAFAAPAP